MEHKIVLDKDGYLNLYRKKHWFSRWKHQEITCVSSREYPEHDGVEYLEERIQKDTPKDDVIIATYTNGVRDE